MPCRVVGQLGPSELVGAIICSKGERSKPCVYCGRPSARLCDFPLTGAATGRTCDRAMCASCTWSPAPNMDFCRPHRAVKEAEPPAPDLGGEAGGA